MARRVHRPGGLLAAGMVACASTAGAQIALKEVPAQARGLDVTERVGETIPMDLVFTHDAGDQVRLGDYFPVGAYGARAGKPTVVALGYYGCPTVCWVTIAKLTSCFKGLEYTVGKDFNALFFSINHDDLLAAAQEAKRTQLVDYGRGDSPEIANGWRFHIGDAAQTRALADAIGWDYRRLPDGEYSHPVCFVVLTPEGKISRYKYGYADDPKQMKLMLLDASEGKLAKSIGDRFLHFCYRYDPNSGSYTLAAFRVMQVGGLISMLGVAGLIAALRVREKVSNRGDRASAPAPAREGARRWA